MDLLIVILRWHGRDKLSIREISRRTGLSRHTIRKYLASGRHYTRGISFSKSFFILYGRQQRIKTLAACGHSNYGSSRLVNDWFGVKSSRLLTRLNRTLPAWYESTRQHYSNGIGKQRQHAYLPIQYQHKGFTVDGSYDSLQPPCQLYRTGVLQPSYHHLVPWGYISFHGSN